MTMRLSDTLGSVEFLEVVGDDLEVPPAWKFEAEVRGSKFLASSGERCRNCTANWSPLLQSPSTTPPTRKDSTAPTRARTSSRASQPNTAGKVSTNEVYCFRADMPKHSLQSTFQSLLLWSWWAWNFFLALSGLKQLDTAIQDLLSQQHLRQETLLKVTQGNIAKDKGFMA